MNGFFQRLKRFCGSVAGIIFFISGLLKLLDPVGTGLVMDEYFNFFHLGFLGFLAKPLGIAFALLEALLGTALICGVWRKITAITAFSLMGFFTLITIILVILNPEMDCGCFGEAIELTHKETLAKNIFIILLLLISSLPLNNLGIPKKRKYVSFGLVSLSTVAFTIYSLISIPLVDFTDYEPGAHLIAASGHNEESDDMYEAIFIYEKDGKKEEFKLDNLPDSTWAFVETKTVLKEDILDIPISLSFYDDNGEYADTLATTGRVLIMSFYDSDIWDIRWEEAAEFYRNASVYGFRPLILVTGSKEEIDSELESLPAESASLIRDNLFYSDYKTLITLNRSNGGITFFSDGFLISKWSGVNVPDKEELKELSKVAETETLIGYDSNGGLIFQGFLLYVFAIMLLL